QDFCELIVEDSWLNQLDDVIVGHGISLLRWRSGGVKHPHDMPPSRFPPSPTLGDSSGPSGANRKAESTDAPERGGLLRSSEEAAVMVVERRGRVIDDESGQLATGGARSSTE